MQTLLFVVGLLGLAALCTTDIKRIAVLGLCCMSTTGCVKGGRISLEYAPIDQTRYETKMIADNRPFACRIAGYNCGEAKANE